MKKPQAITPDLLQDMAAEERGVSAQTGGPSIALFPEDRLTIISLINRIDKARQEAQSASDFLELYKSSLIRRAGIPGASYRLNESITALEPVKENK